MYFICTSVRRKIINLEIQYFAPRYDFIIELYKLYVLYFTKFKREKPSLHKLCPLQNDIDEITMTT